MRHVCLSILGILFGASLAHGATLTVCASGCAFNDFQKALDAAQPGDTILLRAGETFVGHFSLPNKANTAGAYITIRSDAPDSAFPPAGTRLIPPGRTGANVSGSSLARLVGRGGQWKTTPVLQAAPGAHHYRLQFLDIDGINQEGWYTLVSFGVKGAAQDTLAEVPGFITLDRVFIHGHPKKGQKRCLQLNAKSVEVLNSYISSCASFDADSQAIAGYNGPGPFRIINNYLEGSGENVMFGGADPSISNLIPSDIELRRNHFAKPLSWRNPILAAPSAAPGAAAAGTGSLAAGTHYFKVVARMDAQNAVALSAPSAERSVAVSAGSAVKLTWNAVAGAERYRIYRGTSAGGENRYLDTTGTATSFTYTGSGELAGTPPSSGTRWVVKNLLELKNAQRVTIDGNLFEHVWSAATKGFALVFTPRNQEGTAPWSAVRDVTVTNNIIRRAAGAFVILGTDDNHSSQPAERITIRNNLAYDLDRDWGVYGHFLLMTRGPRYVTVDHNTIFQGDKIVLVDDGTCTGFVYTNNIAPHNQYGLWGSGAGSGIAAINAYFPSAVVRRNVFGGGPASKYPPDNFFPDLATFNAQFVNVGAEDFRLVPTSSFRLSGTDGKDIGVDFGALQSAQGGGTVTPPSGGALSPYGGTRAALPGTIQVENFDEGGAGVAYQDTSAGNSGGKYRTTDVDIESTADSGGGHNLGWFSAGEWLKYSVTVGTAGTYDLEFRIASKGGGGSFHLEADGSNKTGAIAIPNTGGWQTWTTVRRVGVSLSAGQQVWRFVMDQAGSGGVTANVNFIRVVSSGTSEPPTSPSGGDIVLYASDVSRMAGNWTRAAMASAAGGQAMQSADRGWSTADVARAAPADYFEVPFTPEANRAYRIWVRMRAQNDSKWNESIWVQFSGAVNSSGAALWPIGTTSALLVNLEHCSGCGVSGWGWQNRAYWVGSSPAVRFATSAQQTIRIQTREDGVQIDQIVLSPVTYYDRAPGALKNDTTIMAKADAMSAPPSTSEIVLYASDATRMSGNWTRTAWTSAAGGQKLASADRGWSTPDAPLASPADFVEATFTPESGRAYRVWLRMRASGNSKWNDAVWVQFSGAVNASGGALWRIGTTDALPVNLEDCSGCGVSDWGWQDGAWWLADSAIVRFASATTQTIRIQTREDGVEIDQIVLSPVTYFENAPGTVRLDATVVPK